MTTVVTDLDEQWGPMQAALQSSPVMVLPGRIKTSGPYVDYANDLVVLGRILADLAPRVVYVQAVLWTDQVVSNFVALCRVMGQDDEEYPGELAAARHAQSGEHLGKLASVDVGVVADGVMHVWSLTAQWFDDMTRDVHDIVYGERAERASK